MSIQRPQQPPSQRVITAFGAQGAPVRFPGGEGTSWRVANLVFKPAYDQEQLAWWAQVVADIGDPDLLRLPTPARTSSGALVVDGWTATHFLEGEHESGRWVDVARAGETFCDLLEPIQRPGFLARRQDPWARADRIAWGEEPLTGFESEPLVTRIIEHSAPLTAPEQIMHGDLTGNVLFHPTLPPAVIDPSLYWRPRAFTTAIVAVDAIAFHGAGTQLIDQISHDPDFPQYLLRALLYRMAADAFLTGTEQTGFQASNAYVEITNAACHRAARG